MIVITGGGIKIKERAVQTRRNQRGGYRDSKIANNDRKRNEYELLVRFVFLNKKKTLLFLSTDRQTKLNDLLIK